MIVVLHRKNAFAERFKILAGQIRKVILLDYQNNYVQRSNQLLKYPNFL